jgi:zinc transport system permease protein
MDAFLQALSTPFIQRAILGGAGIALIAGPIGVFIVWRRMAYFGDTLAHSGLLGVCLGFLVGMPPTLGVAIVCFAIAALLIFLQNREKLAADTLLGLLAHTSLALGLVGLSFLDAMRFDLSAFLFGDLLAVGTADLIQIWAGGAIAFLLLLWIWRPLLAATVDKTLARAEGVPVVRAETLFILLVALVVACAMKIVGVLLITALIIIPAATAQRFAQSPEGMAVASSAMALLALALGLAASLFFDTPSSASVVAAAALLFVASRLLPSGQG